MSQPGGVEGTGPKPEVSPVKPDLGQGPDIGSVMKTPIQTTGDLKAVLIQHFGQEEGTKFYNTFMVSFGMMLLAQVQHSAQQAQKAARNMRLDVTS